MKVLVKVHGLQLSVPCGDGRQSCRWLALAVAQRYALSAPHGRCRTREDAHLRRGFFLPAGVAKADGQVLAPDKLIADVCKDNDVLTVTLQQEVPVNELGAPQFGPWTRAAFFPSSHKLSAGAMAADPKDAMAADAKDAPRPAQAAAKAVDEDAVAAYARSELLQQVASGRFQSELEAEAAFLYDWGRARADALLADARAREATRDALLAHVASLHAAYAHYAAGSGEASYGMSGRELAHLCHEAGLAALDRPADRARVEQAVAATLRLRDPALASPADGGGGALLLSRAGFVHALLRLLLLAAGGEALEAQLEAQLADKLAPAAARLTSGPLRDLTHDDRVVAAVLAAKPKLLKLYARYALELPSTPPTQPALLSASALRAMLDDCGMFCAGDEAQHARVFRAAVEQSVAGASASADSSLDATLVVFAEMLEVVARVALAMLSSGSDDSRDDKQEGGAALDLPPLDAVCLALEALRSLPVKPPAPPARRK